MEPSHTLVSIKLDEQEFRNIVTEYYVTLCLFACRFVEDKDTAADIVQDTFAKLWQIRKDFFYLHQIKSFLYTTVRNKALNVLEHLRVVDKHVRLVSEKKTDSFFHDAVVEEETCRIVTAAINRLPERMKAIMFLALDGKKNSEIAEELYVSYETVRTLKKEAYKKLREYLKNYYSF